MKTFSETYRGNGLSLCVHRFADEQASPSDVSIVLLHGFMDSGATWDLVASELCTSGASIYAPDFRGFGRSDRVTGGGYYHFPDYVADITRLIDAIAPRELVLVGHSMGGTVACLYAGAFPERVQRLVLLEGVGPPAMDGSIAPLRMRRWLGELAELRAGRPLASVEDAARRLSATHPRIDRAVILSRARHLTIEKPDGTLEWAHDPLHRTTSPSIFHIDAFKSFLAEVRCPVTFVSGGETGWHPPDEGERLAAFPTPPRVIVLDHAGHMMHWTEPTAIARAILATP